VSGKLSEVEKRIGTVHQLDAVISAMRGIAAARVHEAHGRLDGVREYASVVGAAIGEALALPSQTADTEAPDRGEGGHILIVLCAEQGFAGSFSERVLDKAVQLLKTGSAELLLVGARGTMIARERNLSFGWSAAMVVHTEEAPSLANRITDALYDRLQAGRARRVTAVYAEPGPSGVIEVVERVLLPFDFTRFHVRRTAIPPIVTLPPEQLLAELADEYVYAELCEAVMLSYAAENEARMQAMIAARRNVEGKLGELVGTFRTLRQEEITAQIIELSVGTTSAERPIRRKRTAPGPIFPFSPNLDDPAFRRKSADQ
jgi:F-type H+-transporting ATPase subunit gamma